MNERQLRFKELAISYLAQYELLSQLIKSREDIQRNEGQLRNKINEIANKMKGFVGRNIQSRCVSLNGKIIAVRYNASDEYAEIIVWDEDGKEIK